MMYKWIGQVIACVFLLGACNTVKQGERMIVASQRADCVGVAPQKCLLVKTDEETDWEYFYDTIEGFNYEPGYEYVLEVKRESIQNPVPDRSSIRYILVKQISKKKKTSNGLPPTADR